MNEQPSLQYKLLGAVHRAAKIGTWEARANDELLWSDETLELFGIKRSEFGGSVDEFYTLVHPDDVERVKRVGDFAHTQNSEFKSEYRIVRPDGEIRYFRQTAIVLRHPDGSPKGFSGVVQDVSEQVETEAKLRQAQKMELIGQLSGGVAHDFNNILAVITGASELLKEARLYDGDLVETILRAADRGSELTHSLLAFARKQPLRTVHFDVGYLIEQMAPLLDRLLGQDIKLELELSDGLLQVEADPAPLEEALLNLIMNARDAIVGDGCIRICCSNSVANQSGTPNAHYVEVLVADNGSGMPDCVLERATEPFFTTKPVGKGSGLGLSMVDGYVRQSGGSMQIRSALGSGTQVSLLLPRSKSAQLTPVPGTAPPVAGKGETVLVIDDNMDLANLIVRQLSILNYRATRVAGRNAALEVAKSTGGFDIVLSDVLLAGGERGPDVAKELQELFPGTKVVLMTGYASNESGGDSTPNETTVLRKPTKLEDLAKALRGVTDCS